MNIARLSSTYLAIIANNPLENKNIREAAKEELRKRAPQNN